MVINNNNTAYLVSQHNTLWFAGGAGGVDDNHRVLLFGGFQLHGGHDWCEGAIGFTTYFGARIGLHGR